MKTEEIAAEFGLKMFKAEPISHAVLSKVFIINDKFVLRSRTLESDVVKRFQREQELLQVVRGVVPVKFPELLKIRGGDRYLIEENFLWTAYPLIEGEILCAWWNLEKLSEEQAQNTFTTLKELHSRTSGKLTDIDIRFEYQFLDDVRQRLQDIGNDISEPEMERTVEAAQRVEKFQHSLSEKDHCFVHGDYHPGNVLFKNNQIVGLLDTDWARKGSQLEDLAYTLMMFLRDYREKFSFNENHYWKFLTWYGIRDDLVEIFNEYLILYAFYDTHLFRDLTSLPDHKKFFEFQRDFLKDLCMRY